MILLFPNGRKYASDVKGDAAAAALPSFLLPWWYSISCHHYVVVVVVHATDVTHKFEHTLDARSLPHTWETFGGFLVFAFTFRKAISKI